MRKILVSVSTLFIAQFGWAQVGGNHAYQFLNLIGAPRQAALGGNNVTNFDGDVNQAIYNPAAINPEMDNRFSLNYGSYYGDVSLGTAAYSKTFNNERSFHVGVSYLNYGTIDGYDENGIKNGTFSGNDVALSVGYGHHIDGTNFHFGANIKVISSTLESYNSLGAGADIGGMYVDPDTGWNIGLSFRNIGTQLTSFNEERESMPFEVIAGISKKLENVPIRWHLTIDNLQKWDVSFSNPNRSETDLDGKKTEENVGFFNNVIRHVTIGTEFFPDKNFNIRLAYNFRKGEEMRILENRHFSGFSAGFGFKLKRFRFDYSYTRYTAAANTSLFGVSVNL